MPKKMWAKSGSQEGVGEHPGWGFAMPGFIHPLQQWSPVRKVSVQVPFEKGILLQTCGLSHALWVYLTAFGVFLFSFLGVRMGTFSWLSCVSVLCFSLSAVLVMETLKCLCGREYGSPGRHEVRLIARCFTPNIITPEWKLGQQYMLGWQYPHYNSYWL